MQISTNIVSKKDTDGVYTFSSRTCCEGTVIKIVWNWHKDRQAHKWNRTVSADSNSHMYIYCFMSLVALKHMNDKMVVRVNAARSFGIHIKI